MKSSDSDTTQETYDYRRFSILFIHEDGNMRTYFRKLFEQDFEILTAADSKEALALCDSHRDQIAIAMADQDLKDITGAALLMKISRSIPTVKCVLSLKYTTALAIYGVPCDPAIYRFAIKPWDIPQLHTTLLRAMEFQLVRHERDQLRAAAQTATTSTRQHKKTESRALSA